jgi:hypothetical protein
MQKPFATRFSGRPVPSILRAFPGFPRLDPMLDRLRIDGDVISVETLRELQWTCIFCDASRECSRWLKGDVAEGYGAFCPNTATLDALGLPAP